MRAAGVEAGGVDLHEQAGGAGVDRQLGITGRALAVDLDEIDTEILRRVNGTGRLRGKPDRQRCGLGGPPPYLPNCEGFHGKSFRYNNLAEAPSAEP
jgi:hypothetical protein